MEEDKREHDPKGEAKRRRLEQYEQQETERRQMEEKGGDFEKEKLLNTTAETAEQSLKKKDKKKARADATFGWESTMAFFAQLADCMTAGLTRTLCLQSSARMRSTMPTRRGKRIAGSPRRSTKSRRLPPKRRHEADPFVCLWCAFDFSDLNHDQGGDFYRDADYLGYGQDTEPISREKLANMRRELDKVYSIARALLLCARSTLNVFALPFSLFQIRAQEGVQQEENASGGRGRELHQRKEQEVQQEAVPRLRHLHFRDQAEPRAWYCSLSVIIIVMLLLHLSSTGLFCGRSRTHTHSALPILLGLLLSPSPFLPR